MLQREHSAILSTFIKLPFVIKTFVLSIFEWPFYTGFTVHLGESHKCSCLIEFSKEDREKKIKMQGYAKHLITFSQYAK